MDSVPYYRRSRRLLVSMGVVGLAGLIAACSSSSKSTTATTTSPPTTSSASPSTAAPSATVPAGLSTSSFNNSFSIMPQFRGLTAAGKGMVGVILPDTTSSTRYVDFDAPYLSKAFQLAGYTTSQFKVNNAQGSESTQLADAQADISEGASVLLIDQLSNTVGNEIVSLAAQHGVKVIAYDRAIFTGTNTYYVSFDNLQVGKDIGTGFNSCVAAWGISKPQVFELSGGEDIDANAVSFAQGYNTEIWNKPSTPLAAGTTNSKGWVLVGEQITPGWVNATGGTIFQQQFTAHPTINATVEANDGLAERGHHRPQEQGRRPQEDPHHRPGCHPAGHGEHPHRLPVRIRLQAHLQGGPGPRSPWPPSFGPGRARRP